MSGKYQTFEPGKYFDWERKIIEERIALAQKTPPKDRHGPTEPISEYEILDFNHKWDPYNPLFTNKGYAQKAGYPNVFARPCFRDPLSVPAEIPQSISEIVYVRQGPNDVEMFAPIFPGDSLTTETEKIMFEELTVPGSDLRFFRNGSIMRMYNQRDELVVRRTVWQGEAYKKIIDGSEPPVEERFESPAHYTTDEEWEYIKEMWGKEYIRGKDTLYWEDVKVGDEPTWTCSGPITYMDMIRWHGGGQIPDGRDTILTFLTKGVGRHGARSLLRDRFGDYLIGVPPMYGGMNIPGARAMCYNNTCAMLITRLVTNYIGDAGFVTRIGWMFQQFRKETQYPREGGEYLDKVPYMKGKACTMHPFETDTVIAKSYVTDKYINDKGEHIIDLVCWGESLDKRILEVVPAAAKLPSRGG